jgi:hypothetical protein
MPETTSVRELLRHTLATISYRAARVLREVPAEYADFEAGHGSRTPRRILAHMGDLLDWSLSMANGERKWRASEPLAWPDEVNRFFASVQRFDDFLAGPEPLQAPPDKLLQAPLADTLTHIGQLGMLRRLAGFVQRSENFYKAEITTGRVGRDQAAAKLEFD